MRTAAIALSLAAVAGVAHADDAAPATTTTTTKHTDKGALGVGVVLGEPTGVCMKIYLKDDQAIAAAVGGDFISGGFQVSGDYLFHPFILQERDSFVMPFYVGPGVRFIEYGGDKGYAFATGVRAVAGMLFDFKEQPLDVFVEVAGVIETGYTGGHGLGAALNAGAGIRYYFFSAPATLVRSLAAHPTAFPAPARRATRCGCGTFVASC